jgi:hypothetical protein
VSFRSFTRIEPDGSVTSVQSLEVPGAALPEGPALEALLRSLARRYTAWISRLTAGVVAIREARDGRTRAVVVPSPVAGLVLGPPRVEGSKLVREIEGGFLVARRGGTLAFGVEASADGARVSVELHGFRPRILQIPLVGEWTFFKTQDAIHVRHSRGFLRSEVAPRLRQKTEARRQTPEARTTNPGLVGRRVLGMVS